HPSSTLFPYTTLFRSLLTSAVGAQPALQEYSVPAGSHPHDVAPAANGGVWFTAQAAGYLGWLDPASGDVHQIPLGEHSAPHGVIDRKSTRLNSSHRTI